MLLLVTTGDTGGADRADQIYTRWRSARGTHCLGVSALTLLADMPKIKTAESFLAF